MTAQHQHRTYERAVRLHNRAAECQSAGNPVRPEKLYIRSLELKERLFGTDHIEVAMTLNNLGLYYKSTGRMEEAAGAYRRALAIFEREWGASHPAVGDLLYNISQLLRKQAEAMESRSCMITEAAAELADESWRERTIIRHELAFFKLEPGRSRVHRFGVFAGEPIPAARDIIEYKGERVSRGQWVKRCADRTYLLRIDKYWAIDGSVGGSGAELINHCCEPNCEFRKDGDQRWVSSLREIAAGEELLLDYHFPKDCGRVPCYCGAKTCRGTINVR